MKNNKYLLIAMALLLLMQTACLKSPDVIKQATAENRPLLTILKNNYAFSMFYTALQRTGLDKTISGTGPYTLLVPDNNAFASSGISADSLAKIDTATLKRLLNYHIIPISITYAGIPQTIDTPYPTLAGQVVYFSEPVTNSGPTSQAVIALHVNGIVVNKADIAATNGYIIALNNVLHYPAASVKDFLQNNPKFSLFTQALKQFGLFDQLDKTGPFVVLAPSNDAFANYGIDKASLTAIDTLTYKKFLFGAYILTPNRFFLSDYTTDAKPAHPLFFTPNYVSSLSAPYGSTLVNFGILALNYETILAQTDNPPYYGNPYIFGPPANIVDPDHLAINGIVHGLDGVVMIPDSVKIHK